MSQEIAQEYAEGLLRTELTKVEADLKNCPGYGEAYDNPIQNGPGTLLRELRERQRSINDVLKMIQQRNLRIQIQDKEHELEKLRARVR